VVANNWTLAEAVAQDRAAEAVGAIATRIAKERPDSFIGSALSDKPGGTPTLYLKGPADAFVRELVAESDVGIRLADNQPYSLEELGARSHRVHAALAAAGFRDIVTGTNIAGGGVIPAGVSVQPGLTTSSSEILSGVPEDLRGSVNLTISDASGFRDTASAYGGMWVTDGGANECTSGWTVRKFIGDSDVYGVTTAGHCSGIDGIREPGVGIHSFPAQAEHRGAYGDVEWHTSAFAGEALFYAGSSTVRPALYLEPRSGISLNETVCQYGRASNYRDCGLHVYDVSIECTLSGVYNNRLVQMNGITSSLGDSGGGWFYDYKAYGSQKGWCQNRDAWSVADLYDEALGVEFVIYE
jgi:streptogrisin C